MALDAMTLRRRAAAAAFGDFLDEAALQEAVLLQRELLRGDSISDMLAYVDAVGQRNMFDPATCKRLYTAFYAALRAPESSLPPDPLPPGRAAAPVFAAPRPAYAAPPPPPVIAYAPPPAPEPPPAVAPAAPAPVASVLPGEPPLVFAAVVRSIVAEIPVYHPDALAEVGRDAVAELARSDVSPALKDAFRAAWQQPQQADWALPGLSLELAALVRVLFVALNQAFGRAGADQILARGLQAAERLPEARAFSPKRLLSAM